VDEKIRIEGLAQVSRAVNRVDKEAAKQLRLVGNAAANLLIDKTRPEIPAVTGRARGSLKAQSTRTSARVSVGGSRAAYYPWLDFGGEGRIKGRPAKREFIKGGRYLYPTLVKQTGPISRLLQEGIVQTAQSAGLDVT
jgi:hypothetical protein